MLPRIVNCQLAIVNCCHVQHSSSLFFPATVMQASFPCLSFDLFISISNIQNSLLQSFQSVHSVSIPSLSISTYWASSIGQDSFPSRLFFPTSIQNCSEGHLRISIQIPSTVFIFFSFIIFILPLSTCLLICKSLLLLLFLAPLYRILTVSASPFPRVMDESLSQLLGAGGLSNLRMDHSRKW